MNLLPQKTYLVYIFHGTRLQSVLCIPSPYGTNLLESFGRNVEFLQEQNECNVSESVLLPQKSPLYTCSWFLISLCPLHYL